MMNETKSSFIKVFVIAIIFIFAAVSHAQNRFDGYSLTVSADATGACPVRFLPQQDQQNHIQVFLAGTDLQRPATGLTGCANSQVQGNRVAPSPQDQKWCFQGTEDIYEIKLSNGQSYLWPSSSGREIGFYNIKDFRPMRRVEAPTPKFTYSDPPDYTKAIRNAMMIMASRQGGTLVFPDGDYIVGTTDGNTRDQSFEGITVPSGVTIMGASGNYSVPTTNLPVRSSAARIRLRNNKQAIFRIGSCTNFVSFRNIELLGNANLYGEAVRDTIGTYGVEAAGKWAIDPASKVHSPNQSQFFRFENVTFQNFDTAIFAHNLNQDNCNAAEQQCNQWQFDNIRVDHGVFINNRTGILINTFNSDWIIANSQFNFIAGNAPGHGIRVIRATSLLIENSFGGGYDYGANVGGTFLYIDSVGTITMIASSSERSQRSIYTAPFGATTSQTLNIIGSVFNDPIELNGRMNFTSTGSLYFGTSFKLASQVVVNSIGDKFCYDPAIYPGHCRDKVDGGNIVNSPGFNGGQIMFRTGRPPEGQGKDRIDRQPNFFGYDVELSKGLMQFDPDITFRDITAMAAPAETGSRVKDGALVYCKDCKKAANGLCTQGQAGTDGAFAKRINNQWRCD
ncbi:MAG TPA: hypothetical protein VL572_12200 [Pyrinomonadaceae bacterium]|nr:hypothetical protein [Pyrinomonadaceae bacterium]